MTHAAFATSARSPVRPGTLRAASTPKQTERPDWPRPRKTPAGSTIRAPIPNTGCAKAIAAQPRTIEWKKRKEAAGSATEYIARSPRASPPARNHHVRTARVARQSPQSPPSKPSAEVGWHADRRSGTRRPEANQNPRSHHSMGDSNTAKTLPCGESPDFPASTFRSADAPKCRTMSKKKAAATHTPRKPRIAGRAPPPATRVGAALRSPGEPDAPQLQDWPTDARKL